MNEKLLKHLAFHSGVKINKFQTVTGGDINKAYALYTDTGKYFVKLNNYQHGFSMLKQEAESLLQIEETRTIPVPSVIAQDILDQSSYLILEWIEPGGKTIKGWEQFGRRLANLHKTTFPAFGNKQDNYIGTLPQSNKYHDSWVSFYCDERLIPQMEMAIKNKLLVPQDVKNLESLCVKLANYCPEEKASLIHGDLWGGNYLFKENGEAALIDPCAYFGHREMDLAMSKLFGGFHPAFYDSYHLSYPLSPGFQDRVEIYQLYYLLVHLNLFGSSYLASCRSIINRYS